MISITAYLGSIGLAVKEVVGGFISQHIALVRIQNDQALAKWVGYFMLSDFGQKQLTGAAYGGTKVQLSLDDVKNLGLLLPSKPAQRSITAYLDRETARLNEMVRAKESLLELVAEKRRALITRAVTRGLNAQAPLRDSGQPWLGLIPQHWEVERSKWLLKERDERSTTGEEEMLTVSHITGVTPRSEKDVNMFEAETGTRDGLIIVRWHRHSVVSRFDCENLYVTVGEILPINDCVTVAHTAIHQSACLIVLAIFGGCLGVFFNSENSLTQALPDSRGEFLGEFQRA